MLASLADVHIDLRITSGLRRRGIDVVTAQDQGFSELDDESLLVAALQQRRILLTNDTDFQGIAAKNQSIGQMFAPILFWPQNLHSIGQIINTISEFSSQRDYDESCSLIFFL